MFKKLSKVKQGLAKQKARASDENNSLDDVTLDRVEFLIANPALPRTPVEQITIEEYQKLKKKYEKRDALPPSELA